jgi:flagellin-like protein
MLNTENRGQVGIGTLIVFIAMVLVAAIAAGVLINTAGLLQAQAQQTGQETTAEVSDIVQVGKIIGEADNNGEIESLNASFRLAAGSDAVNLSKVSYTISSDANATVVNGKLNTSDGLTSYTIQGFEKDSSTILSDQQDLMVVNFNLTNISGLAPLTSSSKLSFVVQAPAGGSTYKQVQAPGRIKDGEAYIL